LDITHACCMKGYIFTKDHAGSVLCLAAGSVFFQLAFIPVPVTCLQRVISVLSLAPVHPEIILSHSKERKGH